MPVPTTHCGAEQPITRPSTPHEWPRKMNAVTWPIWQHPVLTALSTCREMFLRFFSNFYCLSITSIFIFFNELYATLQRAPRLPCRIYHSYVPGAPGTGTVLKRGVWYSYTSRCTGRPSAIYSAPALTARRPCKHYIRLRGLPSSYIGLHMWHQRRHSPT